jgi:hypothetical protein
MTTTLQKQVSEFEKELASWHAAIGHAGADGRPRVLSDALAWCDRGALNWIRSAKAKLRGEFRRLWNLWATEQAREDLEPCERHYLSKTARYAETGGWCFVVLEVVFAAALAVVFMNLSALWAVLIGCGVALLIALALKGLIAPLAIARFEDRPKAGRDWLIHCILVLLPLELVLLLLVFLAQRGASEFAENMFGVTTAVLAITTPVLAGVLFVLAGLVNWPGHLTSEWSKLERLEGKVEMLRDCCLRSLAVFEGIHHSSKDTGRSKPATVATILLMLLLTRPVLGSATAQGVAVRQAAPPIAPGQAEPEQTGRVWIDDTFSVDKEQRSAATGHVIDLLARVSAIQNVKTWELFGFGNQAWAENPFHRFEVPSLKEPPCPEVPRTEATQWFMAARQRAEQRAQAECENLRTLARQAYEEELAETLREAKRAIDQRTTQPSPCTSLLDALERIALEGEPSTNLVITDGRETCRSQLGRIDAPRGNVKTIIVLIGSSGESEEGSLAQKFQAMRERILAAAPWVIVVPPWLLDRSLVGDPIMSRRGEKKGEVR